MRKLTIIVATDSLRGIGINNTLPWHLPQDLAHFKRTTSGHPIIMGRKTFDSIGRALPNRRNIVISRNPGWRHDGVEVAATVAAAIQLVGDANSDTNADAAAFIIGGAQIFVETLPLTERLIVTEIDKNFHCDVFFPPISTQEWQEVAREQHHCAQNDFNYAFVTYQKK
ncbi:MAG: dihydrofolate reductase [Glaciimonas sp.]|nr:dihydrofolate reductase [Glaciimonas sp.]